MAKQRNRTKSKKRKLDYASYKSEGRHGKNKLRRLRRQLKEQPNNKVLAARIKELEKGGVPYTRNRRARNPNDTTSNSLVHKWKGKWQPIVRVSKTVPEYKQILKKLWREMVGAKRPKIRKKRRGKYQRVSTTS